MTGRFIVLEGGDGSGKSTQVPLLAGWLRSRGLDVVETREPGGTPLGQKLRRLLLDGDTAVDPRAEALMMAADRAEHVSEVILPALEREAWVVSDRHVPSSLVYQGVVRGLGVIEIAEVSAWATAGVVPDLVIVLDVTDELAAERRPRDTDRMEREGGEFHSEVRAAYRSLAAEHGWCVVDGSGSAETVSKRVAAAVEERLTPSAP
jgi:dTMP kinase